MNGPADTLFSLFEDLPFYEPALFICARPHSFLKGREITLQQAFKPWALELNAQGFTSVPTVPVGLYSTVLVLMSKNVTEARFDIAKGLSVLMEGGTLAVAGANDANGRRVAKILEDFGLQKIQEKSGNRARAAMGTKQGMTSEVRGILQQGALQRIGGDGGYYSQPGLFSWDRPDKGSEILVHELPDDLHGSGADFGCGYGFLARHVLSRCKKIEAFTCIDADYRAVEAARVNLKDIEIPVDFLWEDLTKESPVKNFDFIIMNPPFHEGKKSNVEIGRAFIRTAAQSLKSGSELWVVANNKMPYDRLVAEIFSRSEKFYEGGGYKVIRAVR